MIELNIVLVSRRHMQVLQTAMQSQRASLLEKQEAELRLLRRHNLELRNKSNSAEERFIAAEEHLTALDNLVSHTIAEQRRVNGNLREVIDNYLSLIDECVAVGWEQKRTLAAKSANHQPRSS